MPWNRATRRKYDRDHLRYPSDLTDEEYQVITDEGYRGGFFFNCVHAVYSWRLYTTGAKLLNQQRVQKKDVSSSKSLDKIFLTIFKMYNNQKSLGFIYDKLKKHWNY